MNNDNAQPPEVILAGALEFTDARERAAYLAGACAGLPGLRQEVESLLAAHEQAGAGAFMAQAAPGAELPSTVPGLTPLTGTPNAPLADAPGDRVGRYRLQEKIGEGGFGVVWMAEQEEPVRRRVAVKIVKLGMDTREVIARFEAERQALALMDHPHIAKVFDGGTTGTGRPFFVMELVRGVPITRFCEEHRLSIPERLALFVQVCQAVQHAHQKGIIHRDLKPSNVLVRLQEDVPSSKVIDFGIAKATAQPLTDKTLFTRFHQWLGTPAYMSPEQAGADREDIDTRSDIYSLGVLLYELLTGQTPFDTRKLLAGSLEVLMRTIREEEPPRPSTRLTGLPAEDLKQLARRRQILPEQLRRLMRGDLDWIVMKALEKNRNRRYDTANALAQDIERYRRQQPVLAAPPSAAYRLGRFVRRHRVGLSLATAFSLLLVAGSALSLWQWRGAVTARRRETHQRLVAETNVIQRREQVVRLDVANGVRSAETDDWFGALLWFTEALRQESPDARAEEMHRRRIGALLNYAPRLTEVWVHDDAIRQASFSPDGRWALTASQDGTARLWNAIDGRPGPVLTHASSVEHAAFSADGSRVITLSVDGVVGVWDPTNGQKVAPFLQPGHLVTHVRLSPNGRRVFVAGTPNLLPNERSIARSPSESAGEIGIWDVTRGQLVRPPFRIARSTINALELSPDGRWLAAGYGGSTLVWNLEHGQALHWPDRSKALVWLPPATAVTTNPASNVEQVLPNIPPLPKPEPGESVPNVARLAFSPDARSLAVAYGDGTAGLLSLAELPANAAAASVSPVMLRSMKGLGPGVASGRAWVDFVEFSADGQRVLLGDQDGNVRLWEARTGEPLGQLKAKAGSVTAFSPDGRLGIFSGQVWDIETDEALSPRPLHPYLQGAVFSPDGMRLLTVGLDRTARLWNLAGGMPALPAFLHDWESVARDEPTERAKPRNIRAEFELMMRSSQSEVRAATFSPDGRQVLTASWNGAARLWDTAEGRALTPFLIMECPLEFAGFNREGTRVVLAGGTPPDNEVGLAQIWDTRTARPSTPVLRAPRQLESAMFSPDGRWLAGVSAEGVRLWDAATGQLAAWPAGVTEPVRSVAFSADGRLLALCSGPAAAASAGGPSRNSTNAGFYTTRLLDLRNGQERVTLAGEESAVKEMHFSPDGEWLVTLALGTNLHLQFAVWSTTTGQLLTPVHRASGIRPEFVFTRDHRKLFVVGLFDGLFGLELPSGKTLNLAEWRARELHPLAVSADGVFAATKENRGVRVRDTRTGEPLSPLLPMDGELLSMRAGFSPNGDLLLVACDERVQLWPLPREPRPPEELVQLAQFLSGRKIDASGKYAEWSPLTVAHDWQRLRSKYPGSFRVAPAQVRAWRERIIARSEKEKRWFPVLYHLDQFVREFPEDETLRTRRARARAQAALETLRQ